MSSPSFINGIIVGAGVVMALMSTGFLYYVAPLENQQGVTTTEIRVAIFLGGIVAAVALAYEFYSKKNESKKPQETSESDGIIHDHTEPEPPENESDTEPEPSEQKTDELSDESKPDMEPEPEPQPESEPPEEKSYTEPEPPPEEKSDKPQESQAKDKKES